MVSGVISIVCGFVEKPAQVEVEFSNEISKIEVAEQQLLELRPFSFVPPEGAESSNLADS